MSRAVISFGCCLAISFASVAHAQDTSSDHDGNLGKQVTHLEEALTRAYDENPNLLAQRGILRSTDALYPVARSAYGPQISIEARQRFARDRSQFLNQNWSAIEGFSSTASLIFTQPLFSFGRRFASEQSAIARIEFGRNQLRLVEAQTMLTVIEGFLFLARDRAAAEITAENLDLLDRQLSASSARFRVREVTVTDLQQVETRVAIGRAQLLNAQSSVRVSESRFLQSVGAPAGILAPPPPLEIGVTSLEEALTAAYTDSPVIQGAIAREKLSRAELAAARAEQYPNLTLQSSAVYGTVTPYSNDRRTTELRSAVVLAVPIIDSGGRRARIEAAKQANDADVRLIQAALRDTQQAVSEAWNTWYAAGQSLQHYRAAGETARKAYDGVVIQEKAGDRTTLDVLDLARDLLGVRTNYVKALAEEYVARASLLAAIGRLEAPFLLPQITRYDPAANFDIQKRRGDLPIVTSILSDLESIPVGDLETKKGF
ncbi:TolC family protein [Sphingorhabdus sp.]|jgi:TolC family type I secretion outer membrane protein|uniref:TolC family protein n=1 Tax=Sphingorhabdus sp. TaxID=1902408 RepID=UPI0037C6F11E